MRDFVFISDDAFTSENLVKSEADIVSTLEFFMTVPTSLSFAQRYLKVLLGVAHSGSIGRNQREKDRACKAVQNLCYYILEHALMSYELSTEYQVSLVAAATVCYSCLCLGFEHEWPRRLQIVSRYKLTDMLPVLKILDGILKKNESVCKHKAVRKKYSHKRFGQISRYEYLKVDISKWIDE